MQRIRLFPIVFVALVLASVVAAGSASALPAPTYLPYGPTQQQLAKATPAPDNLAVIGSSSTTRPSRSKTTYVLAGLVLAAAAATPILLHRSDDDAKALAAGQPVTPNPVSGQVEGDGDDSDNGDTGDQGSGGTDLGDDDGSSPDVPSELPEPRTVLLIGTGIITLMALRQRR